MVGVYCQIVVLRFVENILESYEILDQLNGLTAYSIVALPFALYVVGLIQTHNIDVCVCVINWVFVTVSDTHGV